MKSLSLFDSAIFCILKNIQLRGIGVIVGDNFPCLTAEIALFLRFKAVPSISVLLLLYPIMYNVPLVKTQMKKIIVTAK
ncbi:hypothetical protein, partial [Ruminococcus sp.]|uniref:hypothetical protein n=1 Tax=Ruminococcus sp. TaxID=41978 RepID=UPI003967B302